MVQGRKFLDPVLIKPPKTTPSGSKFESSKFSKCITLSGKNSVRFFMLLLSGVIKLISLIVVV